ncbi:MAG: hypothetical protein ACK4FN_01525 [Acinetobacter johnsonii]
MDIQKSKELSFDTQDFPKEVWVFDVDNLDQGTEISHLMMSHAEEYTKDELLVICRQASMVIDQLRTDLAKAQAVPEGFVSVEDKLPIDGQDIIAFDAIKHCVFKDGEFLQGYFEPDTGHEYTEPVDVTHWIAIEAQEQKV